MQDFLRVLFLVNKQQAARPIAGDLQTEVISKIPHVSKLILLFRNAPSSLHARNYWSDGKNVVNLEDNHPSSLMAKNTWIRRKRKETMSGHKNCNIIVPQPWSLFQTVKRS